jgi:transcriptional regulator with XRE-family HTH domain
MGVCVVWYYGWNMGKRNFPTGPISVELGKLIRKSLNITETELSRRVGVSQDTVSRWLNGLRPINIEHLQQICQAADLDLISLVSMAAANVSGQKDSPK